MLKVAVIGLGDIAQIHVPLIQMHDKVELVAVCDIDENKKDFVEGVNFYTDYKEMVANEGLDVVHVCLPHYLHYPVTKYLAEQGVNVMQEKPLTLDYQEALELIKVDQETDPKIAICFQNRCNASVVKLRELIDSGKYGAVTGVKGLVAWARPKGYYDVKPWRGTKDLAGGGTMINQSIHTLDLMQLIGGEIEEIKGVTTQLLDYDIEVEDTAIANIKFKNGAKGFYMATNANADNDSVEIRVYLEKGQLTIRDSSLYLTDEENDDVKLVEDAVLAGPKSYYGASHKIIFDEFYNDLINDTNKFVTVEEAAVAIRMIDAINLSSDENRTIKMEEI